MLSQFFSRLFALGSFMAIGAMTAMAQAPVPAKNDLPINKRWQHVVGDWIVICAQGYEGRKACAMSQSLNNAKTGQTLAAMAMSRDANGKTSATVTVPMGVLVNAGLRAGVNQQSSFDVPFRTCVAQGCVAQFEINGPLLKQISQAEKFSVAARTIQQQPLTIEFSLRGFAKAHEILTQEVKG